MPFRRDDHQTNLPFIQSEVLPKKCRVLVNLMDRLACGLVTSLYLDNYIMTEPVFGDDINSTTCTIWIWQCVFLRDKGNPSLKEFQLADQIITNEIFQAIHSRPANAEARVD